MQNLFTKIRCVSREKLFLSCLYLYDSGIQVPVRIRKQSRYTDFWRLALKYRAAYIPISDATGKFAQSRYTDFWRPKGSNVCSMARFHVNTCVCFHVNIWAMYVRSHVEINLSKRTLHIISNTYDRCSISRNIRRKKFMNQWCTDRLMPVRRLRCFFDRSSPPPQAAFYQKII